MRIDLLFFDNGQSADFAVIALLAIASTMFVHCNLLRRAWFLTFLAVAAVAHLALIIAFLGTDLAYSDFRLFASMDVLAVIALAFGLEKLVALQAFTRPVRPLPYLHPFGPFGLLSTQGARQRAC